MSSGDVPDIGLQHACCISKLVCPETAERNNNKQTLKKFACLTVTN